MSTLLVTDSRGRGMQKYLDQLAPDIYDVDPYPGENIKKLLTRAARVFDPDFHDSIMIMGGICSLTQRDKIDKITHVRSYDIDRSVRKFRKSIRQGLEKIDKKHPGIQVTLVPTVGINLTVFDKIPADPVEQYTLDSTVMAANKVIIEMNYNASKIPWISKRYITAGGVGGGHIDTIISVMVATLEG